MEMTTEELRIKLFYLKKRMNENKEKIEALEKENREIYGSIKRITKELENR